MNYIEKYLKYKSKYLNLVKNTRLRGGAHPASTNLVLNNALINGNINGLSTGHIMDGVQVIILSYDTYLNDIKLHIQEQGQYVPSYSDIYDAFIWRSLQLAGLNIRGWDSSCPRFVDPHFFNILTTKMAGDIRWVQYAITVLESTIDNVQDLRGNYAEEDALIHLIDRFHQINRTVRPRTQFELTQLRTSQMYEASSSGDDDLQRALGLSMAQFSPFPGVQRQSSRDDDFERVLEETRRVNENRMVAAFNNTSISFNTKKLALSKLVFTEQVISRLLESNKLTAEGMESLFRYIDSLGGNIASSKKYLQLKKKYMIWVK
jgi:hypothetical protein